MFDDLAHRHIEAGSKPLANNGRWSFLRIR
jgi:hypothetical protein